MIGMSKLKIQNTYQAKHLIAMSGLTSKRFAEMVNITPEHMSSVITGKASPSPTLANDIVTVINNRLKVEYQIKDLFLDVSVKKHATTPVPPRKDDLNE